MTSGLESATNTTHSLLSILEGSIANLLAALGIAAIAFLLNWIRNRLLEKKLSESISSNSIAMKYDPEKNEGHFGINIENLSNASIKVRYVIFKVETGHIELHHKKTYNTPFWNEIIHKGIERKTLGKDLADTEEIDGSIKLHAYSSGHWEIDLSKYSSRRYILEDVYVYFEYPTIFWNTAIVKISFQKTGRNFEEIKSYFEQVNRSAVNRKPLPLPLPFRLKYSQPK